MNVYVRVVFKSFKEGYCEYGAWLYAMLVML